MKKKNTYTHTTDDTHHNTARNLAYRVIMIKSDGCVSFMACLRRTSRPQAMRQSEDKWHPAHLPTYTAFGSESPARDPLTFLETRARISNDFIESKQLCISGARTSVDKGSGSYTIFGKWHIGIGIEIDYGVFLHIYEAKDPHMRRASAHHYKISD